MDKKQANIEAQKIFRESNEKAKLITKAAKKQGVWKYDLDSNKELFEALERKTKEKLNSLKSIID